MCLKDSLKKCYSRIIVRNIGKIPVFESNTSEEYANNVSTPLVSFLTDRPCPPNKGTNGRGSSIKKYHSITTHLLTILDIVVLLILV